MTSEWNATDVHKAPKDEWLEVTIQGTYNGVEIYRETQTVLNSSIDGFSINTKPVECCMPTPSGDGNLRRKVVAWRYPTPYMGEVENVYKIDFVLASAERDRRKNKK